MKDKVIQLVQDSIREFDVFIDDVFISTEEGKKVFHIVVDSDTVIDLNRITDVSRVINKILDQNSNVMEDCDELDIYSKEKGDN